MKMSTEMTTSVVMVTLLVMTSSCVGFLVIDLTYELKNGESITGPIFPDYNFTILTRGHNAEGQWVEYNKFDVAEHTGTHMDAPSHIVEGHWRLHQVPPSRLVGPGVVINVKEKVNKNADYAVTVDDLKDWETMHGKIPAGAVVLMNSGWGNRYPEKKRVFNSEFVRDPSTFHFPGFTGEAASWLAQNRDIVALGVDTPSPDNGQSTDLAVHKALLGSDILILENVGNMDSMPVKGTTVIIGVVNLNDGSGGPMRLLALLDLDCQPVKDSNRGWTSRACALNVFAALLILLAVKIM